MKAVLKAPKTGTLILTLGGFLLLAALLALGALRGGHAAAAERVTTTGERVALLERWGWRADPASETAETVRVPKTFSDVYESYNALQLDQGLDLRPYRGRECTLYTYAVTSWPEEGRTVVADLYVYEDRVIAGDIHSTDLGGFMVGLR